MGILGVKMKKNSISSDFSAICWGTFGSDFTYLKLICACRRGWFVWHKQAIERYSIFLFVPNPFNPFVCSPQQMRVAYSSPHENDGGISRAKIRSIQQTVVVILMYISCSTPFICVQLWTVWGSPSQGVCKYTRLNGKRGRKTFMQ